LRREVAGRRGREKSLRWRLSPPVIALLLCCEPVAAQEAPAAPAEDVDFPLRAFGDARLRFESIHSDLPDAEEDALTLRVQAGVELQLSPRTSLLAEAEAVADIYRDGPPRAAQRPLIADREVLELNRFQISHDFEQARATAGRQRVSFDDERFVGSVGFRQNEQTYDAARVTTSQFGVAIDTAYLWQVNRFQSARGATARYRGDTYLVNVSAPTPAGRLTGYRYALDLDDGLGAPLSQINSSVTSGLSLVGRHQRRDMGLGWRAEYAEQRDHAGNPVDYSAGYWRSVVTLDTDRISASAGGEVLGSGGARAFQTPLASGHAFLGSAGVFAVTPAAGLRDAYLEFVWRIGGAGPIRNVTATVRRHWFTDDINGDNLGKEWDALLQSSVYGVQVSAELASYSADQFGVDTRQLWLSIRRNF
jgi:hypothetical protein